MLELKIFLISIPLILATTYYFHVGSGTLNPLKLNFLSFVYFKNYILLSLAGGALILFNVDGHHMLSKIFDQNVRVYGYVIIVYTFFAMGIVFVFLNSILNVNMTKTYNNYIEKDVYNERYSMDGYILYPYVAALLIASFSVLYTVYYLGYEPITFFIRNINNSSALTAARNRATFRFAGNDYIKNIFALQLPLILSYIAYVYYKKTHKLSWAICLLISFTLSIMMQFHNFAKAPPIWYIFSFIFINILLGQNLSFKKYIKYGVLMFVVIMSMYYITMGISLSEMTFNRSPIGRTILSQISGLYNHLDLYPRVYEFLDGQGLPSSFRMFLGIDGETIKSARVVQEHIYPRQVASGQLGFMSTLFQGESYANFGILGAVLAPFQVGILFYFIYLIFLKCKKTAINISLFVWYIMFFSATMVSQYMSLIYSPIVIVITVIAIGMNEFSKILFVVFGIKTKDLTGEKKAI